MRGRVTSESVSSSLEFLSMTSAIKLNDHFLFNTAKVNDAGTNDVLSSELEFFNLPIPQTSPKLSLVSRLVSSKFPTGFYQ